MRKNSKISKTVEMVDFDQIREMACISLTSSKGKPLPVWIHRDTFISLTDGLWDVSILGNTTSQQQELKDAISREVKGKGKDWFDTSANILMTANARKGVVNIEEE